MKIKQIAPIVIDLRKNFFPEWSKESQGYIYIHKGKLERWLTEYENDRFDGEYAIPSIV